MYTVYLLSMVSIQDLAISSIILFSIFINYSIFRMASQALSIFTNYFILRMASQALQFWLNKGMRQLVIFDKFVDWLPLKEVLALISRTAMSNWAFIALVQQKLIITAKSRQCQALNCIKNVFISHRNFSSYISQT